MFTVLTETAILANTFPVITPNFNNPIVRLLANVTGHVQGIAITLFVLLLIGAGVLFGVSRMGGNQRGQHFGVAGLAFGLVGLVVSISAPSLVDWLRQNEDLQIQNDPAQAVQSVIYDREIPTL